MCDSYTLTSKVRPAVDTKIASRALFTSVDIAKAAGLPHREARDGCRQLWRDYTLQNQGYDRTLERMGNGQSAFVYHPQGVSASSYSDRNQNMVPGFSQNTGFGSTPAQLPSLASVSGPTTTAAVPALTGVSDADTLVRNLRSDGAVEISKDFVEAVKRPYQDTLYGHFDAVQRAVLITGKDTGSSKKITVYSNGSARIPKSLVDALDSSEFELIRANGILRLTGEN